MKKICSDYVAYVFFTMFSILLIVTIIISSGMYSERLNSKETREIYRCPQNTEYIHSIADGLDCHSKVMMDGVVASSKILSIGTDREKDAFGFDFSKLCRIITAEAGNDFDLAWGIATACYNAQMECDYTLDPCEVCEEYQYADEADFISDAAKYACIDVYVHGNLCEDVGNSTMFYNPTIFGESKEHEAQSFVCTIGDVRFFLKITN